MDAESRAQIDHALLLARRILPEHLLDRSFARQTKNALRRAAEEKGLDLGLERVSLWRENGAGFEHLASTRTLSLAVLLVVHTYPKYRPDVWIALIPVRQSYIFE